MKRLFAYRPLFLILIVILILSPPFAQAARLRIFIRGGKKTHGPNAHEHERFLNDWKALLAQRGMQTDGAMDFPTAEQLAATALANGKGQSNANDVVGLL